MQAGLRSAEAFTVRRCQILRASANGLSPSQIVRESVVLSLVAADTIDGLRRAIPR